MEKPYFIDRENRLVITTHTGVITEGFFLHHQSALLADPEFDASFNQLVDLTDTTGVELSPEFMRRMAERHVFSPQSRRAVVTPKKEIFGLTRMFQSYRELVGGKEQIQIFEDRDEALRWLAGS